MSTPQIDNLAATGTLVLRWSDGSSQHLRHADLRWACPCAWCRSARISGQIRHVDPEVRVTAVQAMGYGVQLVFDDGHDRGVYPWAYLRALPAA